MNRVDLQKLQQAFEVKLNTQFGNIEVWRHKDYEEICNLIHEKTSVKLSYTTLKRIFGNLEHNASYSKSTLNALAQFIDYKSWDDFITSTDIGIQHTTEDTTDKVSLNPTRRYYNKIFLTSTLLCLLLIILFFIYQNVQKQPVKVNLTTATPIIQSPGVVAFKFDLSQIKESPVFIRLGKNISNPIKELSKESTTYIHNYSLPGIQRISIFSDKIKYDSLTVIILSNGWERGLSHPDQEKNFCYTPILTGGNRDSVLDVKTTDLAEVKYDTANFYQTDFRYFDTLPILLDDFTIETRIKNDPRIHHSLSGDFAALKIYGINSSIKINFTEPSKYANAFFFIAEKRLVGDKMNYKNLAIDLLIWNDIKLTVKNKIATLYINGVESMKMNYTQAMGKFCGIQYNFSRTGAVDYVRLYNGSGELVYNEDF